MRSWGASAPASRAHPGRMLGPLTRRARFGWGTAAGGAVAVLASAVAASWLPALGAAAALTVLEAVVVRLLMHRITRR